jgi:transposase-like protein
MWNGTPRCPYCASTNSTPLQKEHRYHCNTCNTSYAVTVGTMFHKTRLGLHTWFRAVGILARASHTSARQLARDLRVNKHTALRMANRIQTSTHTHRELLNEIARFDARIGGEEG